MCKSTDDTDDNAMVKPEACPDDETPLKGRNKWPEENQEFCWFHRVYQRWTYSYLNPLFAKGSRQYKDGARLDHHDLYEVPQYMKSEHLSSQFKSFFDCDDGSKNLVLTLWKMTKPIYLPAGFCQLITVLCQSTNPLVVRGLLNVLEDNPSQQVIREGLPFAIGLFALLFMNGFANHRYRHLAMKSGVLMRSALVNVIYEHVLHLTPRGRAGLTSGEVSTLVAVDTQKLFEAAQEGHLLWSLPLSIAIVTTFLLLIMGPATLVGIGILFVFLPISTIVTAKMLVIRKKRVKKTDERIELVSSMLQGIKVCKLNNYEENYKEKVTEARNMELRFLCHELAVWALTLTFTVLSPLLATGATLCVYVLVDEENILTASKTFTVLILFSALRFPINYAARFLGKAAQALSALERIKAFLKREAKYVTTNLHGETTSNDDATLILEKASFQQGFFTANDTDEGQDSIIALSQSTFRVAEFDLSIRKGEVVAVVGPVAAGKSTLIGGIIHEVEPASNEGRVVLNGNVAYVPQSAFIINTTLRENILFGLPFEQERYEKVLDACCLRADIEQLGAAQDLTEIGERGVTLSGGQKQRVALARAAYAAPDVVLLDDPLSALDSGTSKLVFEKLIKGRDALFSECAVVLVTHASHFLNLVDSILIIVDGRNMFYGTWSELTHFSSPDEHTRTAVNHIRSSVQEGAERDDSAEEEENADQSLSDSKKKKTHKIMTVEEREYGLSSSKTWLLWFKYAGGLPFLSLMFVLLSFDRFFYVAVEYWIARWTDGADKEITVWGVSFPPQTDGLSAQYDYLRVFATLIALSVMFTSLRSEWAVTGGSRAAKKVHKTMLESVLKAPMSYFETTPLGRILNRFSYDVEVVDITLTEAMSIFMISISWFCAGLAVMSSILPWMLLALFPVIVIYLMVLLHYRKSGVDLQRLDAMSRSPVQAMVSEVFDGSSTIRVFERQKVFTERFRKAADTNSSAQLNMITAQRWLGVRIENLGAFVALVSGTLVVCLNDVLKLEPGMVGLLLIWSSNFTITLGFMLDFFSEAEAAITAIERVDAMAMIPSEKSMETDPGLLDPEWPTIGKLCFDKVCLRYREGLPLALSNLSFTIPAGKTCGVVGRTGAGKSSLTVALFRLVEIESGSILLDGVALSTLGLADVRGRSNGMQIVPQDPFLTGSTLRECIDPFNQSSDADVMEALQAVRMARPDDPIEKLSTRVEEGGSNFSVGERQLLNLGRALLSKPKVLVLDEATASVDGQTDSFIQEMLRTRFQNTTQLTIAHRLHTVMDNDLILVMADGEAAEIGSPAELLQRNSMFAELVDATGPESARALRALVE